LKYPFLLALLMQWPGTGLDDLPDARVTANLIYSPQTQSLLLIDGYTKHPADGTNNVYSWDGKKWKAIPASGPDSKSLSVAALNTKTSKIVVFGGIGSKGYQSLHGDTWEFDGKNWGQVITNDIGTRDHDKMVYAGNLDAFVMYGGQNQNRNNDSSTWILRDGKWEELKIAGPGSRIHFGMVYDPIRKKVVLYGGYNNSRELQKDTWEFDGKTWQQITTEGPGPRGRLSMVYDESTNMSILYGGEVWKRKVDTAISADGELWDTRGDTWGWNGNVWRRLSADGPERMLPALGYDPMRKKLVLFGGGDAFQNNHADTWEFENNKWVKISDNGVWKWNGKEQEKIR
jgi:hypothetical protein